MFVKIFIFLAFFSLYFSTSYAFIHQEYEYLDKLNSAQAAVISDEFGSDIAPNKENREESYRRSISFQQKRALAETCYSKFSNISTSVAFYSLMNKELHKEDFIVSEDLSVEYKPIQNITIKHFINPQTKTYEEVSVIADLSDSNYYQSSTINIFHKLSDVAIGMINTDITRYDIQITHKKIGNMEVNYVLNNTYDKTVILDGISYHTYFKNGGSLLVFDAKRLKAR
ncbi:MAG: hypothetical protein LBH40_05165 [Alphaproteobacteria bacterium]|jgi:hypothetical protein|nr:hypothetical protein [Alphaproteobacteria bacterium]